MNKIKTNGNQKSSVAALLPILVFLLLFFGTGMIFNDFYKMPAIVGFLAALFVAFVQNRDLSFNEKLSVMSRGAGHENIMIMALIFLLAGAFSGAVKAAGGLKAL